MRNLINILDLSTEEIDELIHTATDIIGSPELYANSCRGKILGTLFFEPSTRTRLSFASAMMSLGGDVLGFSQAASSSIAKGETVSDTIRMVSSYSDIIVMRHPKEGAPIVASNVSSVPIINAGDGGHFHPTQTLTDLLTINQKKGRLDNLTVGVCGDLKYGRTVHSLISALARYKGVRFVLIAPDELKLPDPTYKPLPKYQAATRDLSILCDEAVTVAEAEDVITAAAGKLLRSVKLFDIYRGKGVAEGKKSLAFSLELRADDRTLTDADCDTVTTKVLTALKDKLNADLR